MKQQKNIKTEDFIMENILSARMMTLEQENAKLNQMYLQSEYKLLQERMKPHFLFNSLNTIQFHILKDEKQITFDYFSLF